jgi:hypothetical protein
MGKKQQTEEPTAAADQAEGTPTTPANGDAAPAKKPPRDKAAAFRKVGNQRVAKAVYAMRRLLPLANRNSYTYTEDQAQKIRDIAVMLTDEVLKAFSHGDNKEETVESIF